MTNLLLLGSNYDPASGFMSSTLRVGGMRLGETYYIAADGWHGTAGAFQLKISEFAAPANDDFDARQELAGLPVTAPMVYTWQATVEPREPIHPAYGGGGTLWWTWTSPLTGKIGASAGWPFSFAGIAFYTGDSITNLSLVGGGTIWPSGIVSVSVVTGQVYQIAGYNAESLQLHLEQGTLPTNDLFSNAIPLTGTKWVYKSFLTTAYP